jgi:hypothetical protein
MARREVADLWALREFPGARDVPLIVGQRLVDALLIGGFAIHAAF